MKKKDTYSLSFWLLIGAAFLYFMAASMSGPIVARHCATLGRSGTIMGFAVGCVNFSSLLTRPGVGQAADRLPRKGMAIVGFGLMGISNLLCAAAKTTTVLVFGRILVGIGFSVISVTLSTWVAASLPRDKVGSGMGIFGMAQAISAAFAPTLGLEIGARFGYEAVFRSAGIIAFAGVILVTMLQSPPLPERKQTGKAQFVAMEVLPVALILPLVTIPNAALSSFLSTFAAEQGIPFSISIYFPVYAVVLFALRLVTNRQMDTVPYRWFALLCAPAASLSLVAVSYMNGYGMLVLSALLMSVGYGLLNSVSLATCMKMVRPEQQGIASSTYYIGLDLGLMLGPVLGGQIYQLFGSANMFLILSLVPLFSLPILAVSCRYLKKKGV